MTYDGSIRIDTKMDTKGFDSGISALSSSFGKLTNIIKLVGTAITTSFVAKSISSCIEEAEKLQNAMTGLKSIMEGQGKSFSTAQQFINQYTEDGLVPATQAITAYKNLALRGYNTDQIQKVMNALKDSATYSRQASYTLGDAIQSASEGLKNENSILVDNAGVTKNVAKMWEEYAKSIGKSSTALTQAEKIQAEVSGILEETKFQAGDSATYMNSYSGQVARLNQQWLTFKANMGNAFMTLGQVILPVLNKIMSALIKVANIFSAVVTKIFGKFIKSNTNITESGTAASEAIASVGDSAETAGGQIKDALLPFDDLNVLQNDIASGTSGGVDTGVTDIIDDFAELDNLEIGSEIKISPNLEKIIERLKTLMSYVKRFFTTYVQGAIQVFQPLNELVFKPISDFANKRYDDIWNEFTKGVEGFLSLWENTTLFDSLTRIWTVIGPVLEKIWEYLIDIQSWFAEFAISEFWIFMETGLKSLELLLRGIAELLEGDFDAAWNTFTKDLQEARQEAFDKHIENIGTKFEELKTKITEWSIIFKEKFNEVVEKWKTGIRDWWDKHVSPWFAKEKWIELLSNIAYSVGIAVGQFTTKWVTKITDWWNNDVKPWFTIKKWEDELNNILISIQVIWFKIKDNWKKWLTDWWNNDVKPWFTKEKWIEVGKGIKDGLIQAIQDAINAVKNIWNSFWSGFKVGVNAELSNTAQNSVSAYSAEGASISTVNFDVPHLATGAVIPPNAEFVSILGDQRNGRNLEAPEDLIRQIVREESGNSEPRTIITKVYLDKREIAQAVKEVNEDESRANRGFTGGGAFVY